MKDFLQRFLKKLLAEVTWKLVITGTLALITGAIGFALATFRPMIRAAIAERPPQIIRLDTLESKVKVLTVQVEEVKKQGALTAAIQDEFFSAMTEADPRLRQTITRRAFIKDSTTDTRQKDKQLLKRLLPATASNLPWHLDVN